MKDNTAPQPPSLKSAIRAPGECTASRRVLNPQIARARAWRGTSARQDRRAPPRAQQGTNAQYSCLMDRSLVSRLLSLAPPGQNAQREPPEKSTARWGLSRRRKAHTAPSATPAPTSTPANLAASSAPLESSRKPSVATLPPQSCAHTRRRRSSSSSSAPRLCLPERKHTTRSRCGSARRRQRPLTLTLTLAHDAPRPHTHPARARTRRKCSAPTPRSKISIRNHARV